MALASMGKLAMLGEVTCLGAAVLLLPAQLRWFADRVRARRAADQDAAGRSMTGRGATRMGL
jgi:hypothetical protein